MFLQNLKNKPFGMILLQKKVGGGVRGAFLVPNAPNSHAGQARRACAILAAQHITLRNPKQARVPQKS
jgi:hypothetical protein